MKNTFTLVGVLLIISIKLQGQICSKNQLPANLQNGLVAFYPFCGNANDVSGNGFNGTATSITFGVDRFGNATSAGQFSKPNGSNLYIPANSKLQPSSYTLSTWFNTSVIQNGGLGSEKDQFIAGYSPTNWLRGSSYSHWLVVNDNSILASVQWTLSTSWQGYRSALGTIKINEWYHAVTTYDATTQTHKFYLDGVLLASSQNVKIEYLDQSGFYIGGSRNTSGGTMGTFFDGKIDDVGFWNRALTDCEVKQLFNDGSNSIEAPILNLPDTIRLCGKVGTLDAGNGFSSYTWNTGETTQSISPTSSGWYKVAVKNDAGCEASDSTYLSLVNANIVNRDTTICKGGSIRLFVDSLFSIDTISSSVDIPGNLISNLVTYYPFNGDTYDYSTSKNHGEAFNIISAKDRFGNPRGAYKFNGLETSSSSQVKSTKSVFNIGQSEYTIHMWFKLDNISQITRSLFNTIPHTGLGIGFNDNNAPGYLVYSVGPANANWTELYLHGAKRDYKADEWYSVTVVKSNALYKQYINGILENSWSNTSAVNYNYDVLFRISGISEPSVGVQTLAGDIDDVMIFNKALSESEIVSLQQFSYLRNYQVLWSTGDTTTSIAVTPTQTTKYYVTITDGITSCKDSVTVTVSDINNFNPVQDTIRVCGDSKILDAGNGFSSYKWNTGETTQTISPTSTGWYKVTVKNNAGCDASDSTYLSLVTANIVDSDTTICKGSEIKLSIDSISQGKSSNSIFNPGTPNPSRTGTLADKGAIDLGVFGQKNIFSISFWVNPAQVQNGITVILDCSHVSTVNWVVQTLNSGATWNWSTLEFTLTPNSWQHVLLTYDNGLKKVFINGVLVATQTRVISYSGNPNLYLGNWPEGGRRFNGYIDELYITNTILHSNDFTPEFEINNPIVNSIGLWNFNEGSGLTTRNLITATDYSLNNWTWSTRNNNILYAADWSTGETTRTITVSPDKTTKYYVSVSDGVTSCRDSITVSVSDLSSFNPLQDTIRVCGDSILLDAGSAYSSYSWSIGLTTQNINVKQSGVYKVSVINQNSCSAADSVYVSVTKAKILQNDTTICKGSSVTLSIDTNTQMGSNCELTSLSANLRDGLYAYYPFCGNANDLSGANNGTIDRAILTSDKFNKSNSAYQFNGSNSTIKLSAPFFGGKQQTEFTMHARIKLNKLAGISVIWGKLLFWGEVFFQVNSDGAIHFWWANSVSGNKYSGITSQPNIVTTNKWFDITVVFKNNGGAIYVNGESVNTSLSWIAQGGTLLSTTRIESSCNFAQNPGSSMIGGGMGSGYFDGIIDDFFANSRALTSEEIKKLYSIGPSANWSTGSTSNSITVTPTQTTKYYVTVSDGISSCKDSVTVTVNAIDTSITALDATAVCSSGSSVRLQAGVADSYEWLKDGVKIASAVSRQYAANTTGSYRVVVKNNAGCTDTSRAISITLNPNPTVNYTINNSTQCQTGNGFVYTNTSTITSGTMTYSWVLGDGSTATTTNVSKAYTIPGTYSVKLVAVSDKQCKDSITKQVIVNTQPTIPTITGTGEYCAGDSITLSTSAAATRSWYRNNVLISGSTSTTLVVKQPGDYTVTTENGNGCKSTSLAKTITENALPSGTLNTPSSLYICEGTASTLTASGGSSYQWYRDGSIINQATGSSLQTEQEGRYTVKFISAKGCSIMSSNSVSLALLKRPDAAFSYDSYCVDVPTNFSNRSTTSSSGSVTYSWNFGDENVAGNLMNVTHTYRRAGTFTARLIVTPTNCPQLVDTAINVIAIQSPLPGLAYPPVNAIINRPQQLNARSIGVNYLWSPATFLNSISSRTPMTTLNREQLYRIAITNRAGCTTVDTQLVRAFNDRNIYVPEAFSPDNDGRNDRLAPILVGINEMKVFRIYNRWGILVYDNKNANAYTGWDGTYKGVKQPLETYAWVAEGIDVDGQYIRRTGNTVLIR